MDNHHHATEVDYGTGQKKLSVYLYGMIGCIILTIISFWAVMGSQLQKGQIFAIIYISACIQFVVQLICFLRLNASTDQGRMNLMTFAFTLVVLVTIVLGSLWIMYNLNYNMSA